MTHIGYDESLGDRYDSSRSFSPRKISPVPVLENCMFRDLRILFKHIKSPKFMIYVTNHKLKNISLPLILFLQSFMLESALQISRIHI